MNSILTSWHAPGFNMPSLYVSFSLLVMQKPKVMTPPRCEVKGGSNCSQTHLSSVISTSQKGGRSFTVCHTGNKVHTLLISSHLWQNHWHFFWNPISWPTLEENIWSINNSILLLQKCIISCDASHLRLSQILSKTFLSPLCWIARQWTLRSDVWQEMSDFSSLVQDRFLTVSVASTHFRLIRSLILYSCSAADLIQKCTLTWLIDIQQKQAGSLWDVCPKTLYFMAYLQALKVCNIYNDRTV